jgi:patatin-like phospholipase/acyl hydrolase
MTADGGGVKGLTALLILQRIFESIKNDDGLPEVPKPCEYFDMIGGTSTGGYVTLSLWLKWLPE